MSGHYKNITCYSPSDIEKYRKGELSAREMHELEKAALEDPFLADALEGMEIHRSLYEPTAFDEDREDLRTRLASRISGKEENKRVFLPRIWMRWAAAVILLIGLGTVALYSISGHSRMNVDMERQTTAAYKAPVAAARQTPAASSAATDSTRLVTLAPPSATNPSGTNPSRTDASATTAATAKPSGTHRSQNEGEGLVARTETSRTEKIALAGKVAKDKETATAGANEGRLTLTEDPDAASIRSALVVPGKMTVDLMKKLSTEPIRTDTVLRSSYAFSIKPPLPSTKIMAEGKRFSVKTDTVEYYSGLYRTRPVATNNLSKDLAGYVVPGGANGIGAGTLNFKSAAAGFAGKVLDEHDHPLAGVAVYLSGHRDINTTTDRTGQFRLPLQPKDSTQKLLIQYAGYEQTAIDLAQIDPDGLNSAGNIIRLQPEHASLDEVIITGYGSKRKETFSTLNNTRSDETDSLWTKASPTVGKWAYIHYLQTAARKQPVDSTIKGIEIISFIINKKGALSSFKVEQSLSPAHDASTIRLIQDGPAWRLLRGRETRASVRVIY